MQDALLAATLASVCVAIHAPGAPPHELLTIHPRLLLPANGSAGNENVDWDAVSGALRGFLLKLHHAPAAMPPPSEGP